MKKSLIVLMLFVACILVGCKNKNSTGINDTTKASQEPKKESEYMLEDPTGGLSFKSSKNKPYTVNDDGTYSRGACIYKYKVKVFGPTRNSYDKGRFWFEVLTNKEVLTYEELEWSLLSNQYNPLDEKETVIIGSGVLE